jgi:hypothetical protein
MKDRNVAARSRSPCSLRTKSGQVEVKEAEEAEDVEFVASNPGLVRFASIGSVPGANPKMRLVRHNRDAGAFAPLFHGLLPISLSNHPTPETPQSYSISDVVTSD